MASQDTYKRVGGIRTGVIFLAGIIITIVLQKYVTQFLPDTPTPRLLLLVAPMLVAAAVAYWWDSISSRGQLPSDADRDLEHFGLIEYLCDDTKWGDKTRAGKGKCLVSDFETLIYQAARRGRLFIWGQKDSDQPWEIISEDELSKPEFKWRYPGSDAQYGPYNRVMYSRRNVRRVWPRKFSVRVREVRSFLARLLPGLAALRRAFKDTWPHTKGQVLPNAIFAALIMLFALLLHPSERIMTGAQMWFAFKCAVAAAALSWIGAFLFKLLRADLKIRIAALEVELARERAKKSLSESALVERDWPCKEALDWIKTQPAYSDQSGHEISMEMTQKAADGKINVWAKCKATWDDVHVLLPPEKFYTHILYLQGDHDLVCRPDRVGSILDDDCCREPMVSRVEIEHEFGGRGTSV